MDRTVTDRGERVTRGAGKDLKKGIKIIAPGFLKGFAEWLKILHGTQNQACNFSSQQWLCLGMMGNLCPCKDSEFLGEADHSKTRTKFRKQAN